MPAGMAIRRAEALDAGAIARIHAAGWRTAYRDFLPPATLARLSVEDREHYWRDALRENGDRYLTLVAEQGPSLMGFCTTTLPSAPDNGAEITAIYVDPPWWRNGVGEQLLLASMQEVRTAGAIEFHLWVFEANRSAQAFYERFGFIADGESMRHESGQPALRMIATPPPVAVTERPD